MNFRVIFHSLKPNGALVCQPRVLMGANPCDPNYTLMRLKYASLLVFCMCVAHARAQRTPSFAEVLTLPSVSNPEISPGGEHVVFVKRNTDWENNRYHTEVWLSKHGGKPFQLTHRPKSSSQRPKWSPDGQWVAFLSKRGDKRQIQAIRLAGGEAFAVTHTNQDITGFEWAPNGRSIAFLQNEDDKEKREKRKKKYGGYAVEDKEYLQRRLWVIDFDPARFSANPLPSQLEDSLYEASLKPRLLIDSVDFSINDFAWSPDGRHIAFEHQPNPLINSLFKAGISILDLKTSTSRPLVDHPSYDGLLCWSPDGQSVLYATNLSDTVSNYYKNEKLFRIGIDGQGNRQLAADFDENIYRLKWTKAGIFGLAWQKTLRRLVRIDPKEGGVTTLSDTPNRIMEFSITNDGKRLAFTGNTDEGLTEVYTSGYPIKRAKKATQMSAQIQGWRLGASEVISWKSKDGATIEGVLHKPMGFDPKRAYPLLVVIHGGPTGISTPGSVPSYVYPITQWLNKGALVLQPNYRGSAGYGEAFRSLNVRNLGVGDAWDVLSGVDHLVKLGHAHPDSVGAMGWSQGGYISAFLATNSTAFKALSVGAGISNWMTYYVNTDIHPFTRQYLKGTPWSDKAVYEKTSPMANITQAQTPTLIQHGEFDKRVPPANAYELYQGLQDMGVDTKLVIYKGFGHGISKPKERLAAVWHNWQWFAHYVWGESIEIPE